MRRIGLVSLVLVAAAVQGQTRYVTDRTIVELRRGPSTEYLILRNLEAGQALEVLEQDSATGYSRVRVADQGTEGWLLTRFLAAEPIARDKLAAAERGLAAARERVAQLETQVAELTQRLTDTRGELERTQANHGQVSSELADIRTASANVVAIRDQNASLQQRLSEREREVERLTSDNAALAGRSNQEWFIVGAGVLLGGIVIGLIAPSLRRKRRSDW